MSRTVTIALVASIGFAGCSLALRNPSIGELQRDPARYLDKTVSIDGRVTTSWGLRVLPFTFYKVDDGTGEVTVLSRAVRTPPARGSHVKVQGRVNEVAVVGGTPLGLHLEERDLKFQRR
jgi:hypothetical protein